MREFPEKTSARHPYLDMAKHATIGEVLDHLSFESRVMTLDALACLCHNEGHGLTGSDPSYDAEWLARSLYFKLEHCGHMNEWEKASPEAREKYLGIAKECLQQLPELMSRISSRYLAFESALRSTWQIERARLVAQRNLYVEKVKSESGKG